MTLRLPRFLLRPLNAWAHRVMAGRPPDFEIGGPINPYLLRWFVIPRNPFFNIYLHQFIRSDDDRALHDHPWVSVSIILNAGYWEEGPGGIRDSATGAVMAAQAIDRGFPHVWFGVSVEDQTWADKRIPILLQAPAAIRWVSAEPLLGPINLRAIAWGHSNALNRLDWVVAGGESGPDARPMHPDWARSLRDQCADAGVPFLFKQWGEWVSGYDRDKEDPDWEYCDVVARATPDGRWLSLAGGTGFHGERVCRIDRVGKKAAGRTLDGVIHDAYPEARS